MERTRITHHHEPDDVLGTDLFPDISEEMDRRVNHSEHRIKYWIVVGILANLITLILAAIPVVFYLGQMTTTASQALATIQQQQVQLNEMRQWKEQRVLWETSAEQWMISKGYVPPRDRKDQ